MIQRIQSFYLLLTTILAVLFLSGDIINFENGNVIGFLGTGGGTTLADSKTFLPVTLLHAIIPLLSFIIIFMYRKRKLQIKLIIIQILLIIVLAGALAFISYNIMRSSDTEIIISYKIFLPLLMLIFSILAYAGVRKDEKIVRSYDRLR